MYDEATARKTLQEVVLVPADYYEDGEEAVIGFDQDDAALDNFYVVHDDSFASSTTPLIYFANKGDAKMCRYLMWRGASTTKSGLTYYPPLFAAASQGLYIQ